MDPPVDDPKLHPPDVQGAQALDRGRRKGSSVVRSDCVWEPSLTALEVRWPGLVGTIALARPRQPVGATCSPSAVSRRSARKAPS